MAIEIQGFKVEVSVQNCGTLKFSILRAPRGVLADHQFAKGWEARADAKRDFEDRFARGMGWAENWIKVRRKLESQVLLLEDAYIRKRRK